MIFKTISCHLLLNIRHEVARFKTYKIRVDTNFRRMEIYLKSRNMNGTCMYVMVYNGYADHR